MSSAAKGKNIKITAAQQKKLAAQQLAEAAGVVVGKSKAKPKANLKQLAQQVVNQNANGMQLQDAIQNAIDNLTPAQLAAITNENAANRYGAMTPAQIQQQLGDFQSNREAVFTPPDFAVGPFLPTKAGGFFGVKGTRGHRASPAQIQHRVRFSQMMRSGLVPKKESFYAWMMNKADPTNALDLRKPGGGFYISKLAKTLLSNNTNRKRYWPIFAHLVAGRLATIGYQKRGHSNIGRKDVTRALKIYDKLRSPSSEKGLHIPGGKEGKADIISDMALAGSPLPAPRQKKKKAKGKKRGRKPKPVSLVGALRF